MGSPTGEGDDVPPTAAHTKPDYEATAFEDPQWPAVAIEYASTADGQARISQEADEAELIADPHREAALRTALARGTALQIVREEATERTATTQRPRTLQRTDIDRIREQFGVAEEQVRRDNAISHVLAALSSMAGADDLVFFGGTALARTYLPTLRLSEDIDLITGTERGVMAERIEQTLARALQRSHGRVQWLPRLTEISETAPAVLRTDSGLSVRVQLLRADGYPRWPTIKQPLVQRYRDAAAAELVTYTAEGFAASKLNAWLDRHAPRDLYDMWALARAGYINPDAVALFHEHGLTNGTPDTWMFTTAPTQQQWQDALTHQGRIEVGPDTAISHVRNAWMTASSAKGR